MSLNHPATFAYECNSKRSSLGSGILNCTYRVANLCTNESRRRASCICICTRNTNSVVRPPGSSTVVSDREESETTGEWLALFLFLDHATLEHLVYVYLLWRASHGIKRVMYKRRSCETLLLASWKRWINGQTSRWMDLACRWEITGVCSKYLYQVEYSSSYYLTNATRIYLYDTLYPYCFLFYFCNLRVCINDVTEELFL